MPSGMPSIGDNGRPSRQRAAERSAAARAAAISWQTNAPTAAKTEFAEDSLLEEGVWSEPVSESGRGITAQFQNVYGSYWKRKSAISGPDRREF